MRGLLLSLTLLICASFAQTGLVDGPIFWLPPAHPITEGTPISDVHLDARLNNGAVGSLSYTPAAGTVLPPGTHLLTATYTPAAPDGTPATFEVPIVVNPANAPKVLDQPISSPVPPGLDTYLVFQVADGVTSWQWQTSRNLGFTWENLEDEAPYSGTNTNRLKIASVNDLLNGSRYRCVATYPGGTLTSNLVMLFVQYPPNTDPVVYSGSYFGTFSDGGGWAIFAGSTSRFIGFLASQQKAIVAKLSFTADGTFSFPAEAVGAGGATEHLIISGSIKAPDQGVRLVEAKVQGTGQSLSGAFPRTGALTNLSGDFFTAVALGTAQGELHVIVGYDGSVQAVVVTPEMVDEASGTINPDGTATFTTRAGQRLSLALNIAARTVTATLEPPVSASNIEKAGRRIAALSTSPRTIEFAGVSQGVTENTRFASIATRAYCGPGNAVTIGGFVVNGTSSKRVLIRAVGPSLASQGIPAGELLDDPIVRVHAAHRGNEIVAENDDWTDAAAPDAITEMANRVGAAPFAGSDNRSSALLLTLEPGVYSFVVTGKGSNSGVVLLEVYDTEGSAANSRFMSIATRAFSSAGNNVAIGGFVVTGKAPKRLLLRAVGPTLSKLGLSASEVLPDPTIQLHDASHGNIIAATNDNWGDEGAATLVSATGARIGATPYDPSDTTSAGLVITLKPGVYSFIARDKSSGSGVVLVEVYDAD